MLSGGHCDQSELSLTIKAAFILNRGGPGYLNGNPGFLSG